jgi:hypothetical protein
MRAKFVKADSSRNNELCRAVAPPNLRRVTGEDREKYRLIIFGRYPYDQQWRPLLATLLMVICSSPAARAAVEQVADRRHGWSCSRLSSL